MEQDGKTTEKVTDFSELLERLQGKASGTPLPPGLEEVLARVKFPECVERNVFCGCCLRHTATLKADKSNRPYLVCEACDSRSFIKSEAGMEGVRTVTVEMVDRMLGRGEDEEGHDWVEAWATKARDHI